MPGKLPDSRQALADYLDEMLHQATAAVPAQPLLERETSLLFDERMLQSATEAAAQEMGEQAMEPAASTGENPAAAAQAGPNELEYPLQCLMFHVAGHLLSVPLIQLSSVVDWNDSITRLPQSPGWLLGLVKHRQSNLRIVDSRQLLDICGESSSKPGHLLVLAEGDWAITCDRLGQVVNLDQADVQWKPARDDALVLGTIRDSLATLLNPPGIARELNSRAAPTGG